MKNYHASFAYGKTEIAFEVLYVARKTLEISVHPGGRVVVKAPHGATPEDIQARLQKRARWIRKQLTYFDQFEPRTPPRQYVGGETHKYLGRQYRLKLNSGTKNDVKLIRGFFWITCRGRVEPGKVKRLLSAWYSEKAKKRFRECLDRCMPEFIRMGLPLPTLNIRHMKSRWGSLSRKGTLTVNVDLVRAPRECIEYVITHELCHLRYPQHDSAFYGLLRQLMPDWESRKIKLEKAQA